MERSSRYRIYPNAEQTAKLLRWEGVLRFLWNLALEQWLMGLDRLVVRYCSYKQQAAELTQLRAELEWMRDVPCSAQQSVLMGLEESWSRRFRKDGGQPGFKSRSRSEAMGISEPSPQSWRIVRLGSRCFLHFAITKLGLIPIEAHRPLQGKLGTATIKREGDQWFVSIVCHVEAATEHVHPQRGPIAIDRGVAVSFADSDGGLVANPRFGKEAQPRIAHLQRALARKEKGSANHAKAKLKLARAHRKVARKRTHFLHTHSFRYAKNHSVIVLEDLQLKNMTASAKGTVAQPGTNVAQKAGLNRSVLDAGMGEFGRMVGYKATRFGGIVVKVPAAYSSQECSACGHITAGNRPTRDRFRCLSCGYEDHADTNAAKVLLNRHTRRTGGDAVCGGTPVKGPSKQKLRTVRSKTPRKEKGVSPEPTE